MQYTGLKDKSGIEIYEGDNIDVTDGDYNVKRSSIEYSDERATFVERSPKPTGASYPLPRSMSFVKVIGNSYENPELLKAA